MGSLAPPLAVRAGATAEGAAPSEEQPALQQQKEQRQRREKQPRPPPPPRPTHFLALQVSQGWAAGVLLPCRVRQRPLQLLHANRGSPGWRTPASRPVTPSKLVGPAASLLPNQPTWVQVSDHPGVAAAIATVQASLCRHSPHLKKACVKAASAHLTLGVMALSSEAERARWVA